MKDLSKARADLINDAIHRIVAAHPHRAADGEWIADEAYIEYGFDRAHTVAVWNERHRDCGVC